MSEETVDPQAKDKIIRAHVLWAMGAGLIPIPLLDIAAVTGIQLDLLRQLAALYGVDYARSSGKAFVSALTGSTFAAIGSSIVKALPGIGTVLGGVSMSVLSGASTYAVGQVAAAHFANHLSLADLDLAHAKRAYKDAFEQGKTYVSDLEKDRAAATDVYKSLERLGQLREKGIITEAEFEAKKKELLDRL
jgi:uncharacterized protein (DUF697 family)